jgi:hypothetical protein
MGAIFPYCGTSVMYDKYVGSANEMSFRRDVPNARWGLGHLADHDRFNRTAIQGPFGSYYSRNRLQWRQLDACLLARHLISGTKYRFRQ